MENILNQYDEHDLPLDGMWSDVDFLHKELNFMVNEDNFPLDMMKSFMERHNIRWIPCVDPYISNEHAKNPLWKHKYVDEILLTDYTGVSLFRARMFLNYIFIIDFMHSKVEKFWKESLDYMYNQIKFSGIWIDENEITANRLMFGNENHKYYNIPFWPAENLFDVFSVSPDVLHYGGYVEYDVKSLPSILEAKYTYEYLNQEHPFPFVLTRGNGMGSG